MTGIGARFNADITNLLTEVHFNPQNRIADEANNYY
jgi:hypothetical protein